MSSLQLDGEGDRRDPAEAHRTAELGVSGVPSELPFLDRIQLAFGHHDVTGVRAHTDEHAASASRALHANAFTIGDQVGFGKPPDLRTTAHEAAHVVQQRAGVHLDRGLGQKGDPYERHADAVAQRVVAGQSAEALLDRFAPGGDRAPSSRAIQRAVQLDEVWVQPTTTSPQAQLEELRTAVKGDAVAAAANTRFLIVTSKIHAYDADGKLERSFAIAAGVNIGSEGFYLINFADSAWRKLAVKEGKRAWSYEDLSKVDPKKKPAPFESWFEDSKGLAEYVKTNRILAFLMAVLPEGKGSGALPGWAKGKIQKAKELVDSSTGDSAQKPKDGADAPGEKKQDTSSAALKKKPDRIVEWSAENGVFVNVWVDGAHGSVEVKEGQSPEDLAKAIQDMADAVRRARDPNESVGVKDGAKETGFEPDKDAPKGQSTVQSDAANKEGTRKVNAPAYPAEIKNYGADVTVAGATNRFAMELRYEAMTQGVGNLALLDEATNRMQKISYYWELINVTNLKPDKVEEAKTKDLGSGQQATRAAGEGTDIQRKLKAIGEDTKADLESLSSGSALQMAADWPARAAWLGVIGLSNDVRTLGVMLGSYISVLTLPLNEQKIGFSKEGDYLVRCIATPVTEPDAKVVRASSVRAVPIRVMSLHARAKEANDKDDREIREKEAELAGKPPGPEHDELAKKIEAMKAAQSQNAGQSTASVLSALQAKIKVLDDLDAAESKKLGKDERSVEVRLLGAQLELMGLSREEYRKTLAAQIDGVQEAQKRVSDFGEALFRDSKDPSNSRPNYRPSVTLASEENGQVIPMLMMLGEAPDSADGKRHYILADVTSAGTQQKYQGKSVKAGHEGHEEAIRQAFIDFRENADYGRGTIAIQMPKPLEKALGKPINIEPEMRAAPGNRARVVQRLKDLAAVAAVAGLVVTGPAALAVGAVAGVAGAVVAIDSMARRASGERLHFDFETMMDIVSIIGGVAGVAGAATGLLGNVAKLGNTAKRIQGVLHVFAYAQLGVSVVVIPITLEKKLSGINKDFEEKKISAGERAARTAEAFLEAFKDGTIAVVSAAQLLNAARGEAPAAKEPGAAMKEPGAAMKEPGAAVEQSGTGVKEPPAHDPPAKKPGTPEVPGGPAKGGVENAHTAELRKSLGDLQDSVRLTENTTRDDASVKVGFEDGRVVMEVGQRATPRHVEAHLDTVRLLKKFEGPLGLVRKLISQIGTLLKITPGFGTKGFEARAEVKKLTAMKAELEQMIARSDERLQRMSGDSELAPNKSELAALKEELTQVERKLAEFQELVGSYAPGKGFIAADLVQTNKQLAERFGLSEAEIKGAFKALEGDNFAEGSLREGLSKRTTPEDTALFGRLFREVIAGGDKGAAAADFLGRFSRIHDIPDLSFKLSELHAAYQRGDAVLDHGPLQSGTLLEDMIKRPWTLSEGKLGIGGGKLPHILRGAPIDFVIVGHDGQYKIILGKEHSGLPSPALPAVFAAGELYFDNAGNVTKITNKSGHYRPSKANIDRARAFMYQRGILNMKVDVPVEYTQ